MTDEDNEESLSLKPLILSMNCKFNGEVDDNQLLDLLGLFMNLFMTLRDDIQCVL